MKASPSYCESVTERVALGEPLRELADHVATCGRCQRLTAMPGRLAAVAARPDPGLGFSARMTIGAQQRFAVRRKRRIAATAATAVAAAAVTVFVVTRTPAQDAPTRAPVAGDVPKQDQPTMQDEKPAVLGDSDLVDLVRLADTKRAGRERAPWGRIQRPLAPYIQLVKGVAP
jgi:hypothetical protein